MTRNLTLLGVKLTKGEAHVVGNAVQNMKDYIQAYNDFNEWAATGEAAFDSTEWNEMRAIRDSKASALYNQTVGLMNALAFLYPYDGNGLSDGDSDTLFSIINAMQGYAQTKDHPAYERLMAEYEVFAAQV